MKLIQYIKNLIKVAKNYEAITKSIKAADTKARSAVSIALKAEQVIRERTELSADISFTKYDHTRVIIIGRYKNRDYVEVFSCLDNDINDLVPMLREKQKYAGLKFVDSPIEFMAVLEC